MVTLEENRGTYCIDFDGPNIIVTGHGTVGKQLTSILMDYIRRHHEFNRFSVSYYRIQNMEFEIRRIKESV